MDPKEPQQLRNLCQSRKKKVAGQENEIDSIIALFAMEIRGKLKTKPLPNAINC